jgi:hypothetical protein
VDSVVIECGAGDRGLRGAVERALRVALEKAHAAQKPQWPDEIATRMITAWREYLENSNLMRVVYGAKRFFAEGIWEDQRRWHWDRQAIDDYGRARVGSR